MEITLDEFIKKVKQEELKIGESKETFTMLDETSRQLKDTISKSGKITVLTDYDADGITSAYIMNRLIKTLNPECEIVTVPNDRRGSYGLGEFLLDRDFGDTLIILDMGSNQIPMLEEIYRNRELPNGGLKFPPIVLDHHIVEDESIQEKIIQNANYCNLHVINNDDKENAQYCTAGLAYRMYELTGCKERASEKQNNTVLAMAAIGTASDVVDVLDTHSFNREILKKGVSVIDEAEPSNFDFVIGNMLETVKISETTTAHELAYNVGAFLNSASRMSEILEENGAERTFKAIVKSDDKADSATYREIARLQQINTIRKRMVNELASSEYCRSQLDKERLGENRDSNIAVILLPKNTPHAFAGLIAGRYAEAADKAVICLTEKNGVWSGSGRNISANETPLLDFVQEVLSGKNIDIQYGGHKNAVGISYLKDIDGFVSAIQENKDKMIRKSDNDIIYLSASSLLNDDKALSKIMELEPIGEGLQLPPVKLSGTELYRDKLFKAGRKDWKAIRIKQDGVTYNITDWNYDENNYPQFGKKNNEIELTADVQTSAFGGTPHIEFVVKPNRQMVLDRYKELGIEPTVSDKENLIPSVPRGWQDK